MPAGSLENNLTACMNRKSLIIFCRREIIRSIKFVLVGVYEI